MSDSISTLAELKAMTAAAVPARNRLAYLFDNGEYTELNPYAKCGSGLSGVVTAYGYVEGNPVYAFSQDISVNSGALTKVQADKIAKILDMAAATGVPVVGIYDSFGADLNDSFGAMSAYGELLMRVSNLSGVVPQIAVVAGTCAGTAAMLAESADFTVITEDSELYVAPNSDIKNLAENAAANGTACIVAKDDNAAIEAAKNILSKLPQNNLSPVPMYEFEVPDSVFGSVAPSQAEAVFDKGSLTELYADYGKASYTALATLGGVAVGVVATNKTADKLTADDCSKIARFVRTCDAYALPVITLVDTEGFAADDETEAAGAVKSMTKLAHAYAEATTIKLAVVTGKAYGPAYIALAGKGANADMTYAVPNAVISPLNPLAAVEFLSHDQLKRADNLTAKRNELAGQYVAEQASAVAAAEKNSLDDIVEGNQVRDTLISSIEIMAGKRVSRLPKKHSNIQL